MKKLFILTDYNGHFYSKQKSAYYRGGMDVAKLATNFSRKGYKVIVENITQAAYHNDVQNNIYLYTSSEDRFGNYKSFIEDVILNLSLASATVIPRFEILRAHENKIFMEMIKKRLALDPLQSWHFGAFEDYIKGIIENFPVVLKKSNGSLSKGVFLAKSESDLESKIRKIAVSKNILRDFKNIVRKFKYPGFKKGSSYTNKFIIQNYVANLDHDWKILIYGDKYFVLKRYTRANDFRASGSGHNTFEFSLPDGLLNFAKNIFAKMNVPFLSLDIAGNKKEYYLIEFQGLCFGTTTMEFNPYYFQWNDGIWEKRTNTLLLEDLFSQSILDYIDKFEIKV
jgi:hypothetical protein